MKELRLAVEMRLGDLARIAWDLRKALAMVALGSAAISLVVALLLPAKYLSTASILPHKGFLQERQIVLARGITSNAVQLRPTDASNSQNLVTAASFRVRSAIADSLKLEAFFGFEGGQFEDSTRARHAAVDALRRATHFELSLYRDVLFIHVITEDPEKSAAIANLYTDLIERENLRIYRGQARAKQEYLLNELKQLRGEIVAVMDSTASVYTKAGLVATNQERDNFLSLLSELKLQRLALELSLSREKIDRTANDPYIARLAEQLRTFDAAMALLSAEKGSRSGVFGAGFPRPGAILSIEEQERRLAGLEAMEDWLGTELAAAVMEGNRESASLLIMDRAFPAIEPIWPKPWLIVLCSCFLATVLTYLGVLFFRIYRSSDPPAPVIS